MAITVWVNGAITGSDATVSALDHGLTVGDGVFETLRAYDSTPFAFTRHYERFVRSATGLGFEAPPIEMVHAATSAVMEHGALVDARVRWTATAGPGPLGSWRDPDSPPTLVVAADEVGEIAPVIDLVFAPWTRNERGALVGLKTTSYGENVKALAFARARGADEALVANNRNEVCEGTGSNVFVVRDGVVLTPPLDSGCLAGITRALVLELTEYLGIPSEERVLTRDDVLTADEVFITSSVREVAGVARIDQTAIGTPSSSGRGPVSQRLAEAYAELVNENIDP